MNLQIELGNFTRNSRGAVLIEFAFSVPVLIILLLGLHDVFVVSHMQDQSRLVAHEIASMLQNVSQGREDKKITLDDFKRVVCAAYLTMYPGTTMYSTRSGGRYHKFAHYPQPYVSYVKSDSSGKASMLWQLGVSPAENIGDPISCSYYRLTYNIGRLAVKFGKNQAPENIYSGLKMDPNEVKILVDCNMFLECNSGGAKFSDGTVPTLKNSCGLRLINPPYTQKGAATHLFHSVSIFTPRRGIFDDSGMPLSGAGYSTGS